MDIAAYAKKAAAANPMPFANAPAPTPGLVAHVDGDFCAYNCAGNDDTDPGRARQIFLSKLDSIKFASGATSVVVHLTDRASTKGERYLIATVKKYQGQRGGRKPRNWEMLREYMEGYEGDKFRTKNWIGREADDGIAYVAHATARIGKLAVIATADKDMRMLPGRHVIWQTKQLVEVPLGAYEVIGPDDKVYGHKWFWLQMLQGDSADNIPGLEGYFLPSGKRGLMGEATAKKILAKTSDNEEAYAEVSHLYKGYYGVDTWADRFAEQAALLWLRVDKNAALDNFLSPGWVGPGYNLVLAAVARLQWRVSAGRRAIEELACRG